MPKYAKVMLIASAVITLHLQRAFRFETARLGFVISLFTVFIMDERCSINLVYTCDR